jgi:hypothetical protein
MEPRALERFSETMGEEQAEPQTLSPYALDRMTGFYVKVKNVEGLLCCGQVKTDTKLSHLG